AAVKANEPVAALEGSKVVVEIDAPCDGVFFAAGAVGDSLPIGGLLAVIAPAGTTAKDGARLVRLLAGRAPAAGEDPGVSPPAASVPPAAPRAAPARSGPEGTLPAVGGQRISRAAQAEMARQDLTPDDFPR